jgi:hypothetical protein
MIVKEASMEGFIRPRADAVEHQKNDQTGENPDSKHKRFRRNWREECPKGFGYDNVNVMAVLRQKREIDRENKII